MTPVKRTKKLNRMEVFESARIGAIILGCLSVACLVVAGVGAGLSPQLTLSLLLVVVGMGFGVGCLIVAGRRAK